MPLVRLASGLNVHYTQVGTGPDLVLIHGLSGHQGNWHFKIVPTIWDKFRVLTYDIRGHGYTEFTETGYTPTQLATDLKELMDHLGIEKAHVAGTSLGADIALYFGYLYPERVNKVVLMEPIVPAVVRIVSRRDFRGAGVVASGLTKLGVPIPKDRRLDPQFLLQKFIEMPVKWGPMKDMPRSEKQKEWLTKLFLTTSVLKDIMEVGDLSQDNLKQYPAQVHLIFDNDSIWWARGYTFLRDNLPHVTYTVLRTDSKEFSHLAPLEMPEIIAEELVEALAEREPVAGS
jgi:pimeloyl-ACP methyl ester carboxylesterase